MRKPYLKRKIIISHLRECLDTSIHDSSVYMEMQTKREREREISRENKNYYYMMKKDVR